MERWPWWGLVLAQIGALLAYRVFLRLVWGESEWQRWVAFAGSLPVLFLFYRCGALLFDRWFPRAWRWLRGSHTSE